MTYGVIDEEEVMASTHTRGATTVSGTINLLNTIIGAGILAMPFAYKANGMILGTGVIALAGLTAGFGLYLQALCASYVPKGHASFFAVAKHTYPSLAVLFDVAIAVKCFGVGVSYIIIIGDLMPQIAESVGLTHDYLLQREFWVTVAMAVVGPLSYLRKLDSLKYTSLVALVSVGYLVLIVVGHFLIGDTLPDRGEVRLLEPNSISSMLSALPVIIFAFTCHQNMFSVLNELESTSEKSVLEMVLGSIGTSGAFYIVVGLTGYLSYGDNVGGNIIQMYPFSVFTTIGRLAIVIMVIFSYPLQCHPSRVSANHVIHSIKRGIQKHRFTVVASEDDSVYSDEENQTPAIVAIPLETPTFFVLTTVILVLSYLLAMAVTSLEKMLAFVGATGSTSISFILPGIFAYALLSKTKQEGGLSSKETFIRYAAICLAIWGVTVAVVCFLINIWLL